MLFRNYTPFPPLQFESRDEKQNDFGVIVLRGTFQIEQGRRLRLVQKQEPLVMADQYFGEPGKSSLHFESSIAPYKPKTDVLVTATAHAPGGKAATDWIVAVQVGDHRKELKVTGPRRWERRLGSWALSHIEPVTSVPLRYEHAFGGSYQAAGEKAEAYEPNPIGVGFASANATGPIIAPQILPSGAGNLEFGKPIPVEGLGPIAPAWSPRREKAGTFNVIWEKTRWPDLPEDFSFEFYNTASPGLTLPDFVSGKEDVTLTNLTPAGTLRFALPNFELATLLRFHDGRLVPAPINLDTIHVELPENRVYLTWRGVHPLSPPLRVLEVRMGAPDNVIDKSTAKLQSGSH